MGLNSRWPGALAIYPAAVCVSHTQSYPHSRRPCAPVRHVAIDVESVLQSMLSSSESTPRMRAQRVGHLTQRLSHWRVRGSHDVNLTCVSVEARH